MVLISPRGGLSHLCPCGALLTFGFLFCSSFHFYIIFIPSVVSKIFLFHPLLWGEILTDHSLKLVISLYFLNSLLQYMAALLLISNNIVAGIVAASLDGIIAIIQRIVECSHCGIDPCRSTFAWKFLSHVFFLLSFSLPLGPSHDF